MKKHITLTALFCAMILLLAACSSSYSDASMKSGLTKGGYTVNQYTPAEFEASQRQAVLKTTEMAGLKTVLMGIKEVKGEENGILILVFDSISNAEKVGTTSGSTVTEAMSLLMDWGRAHAPETELSTFGQANNVVYAGCRDARLAAGIKLPSD